MDPEIDLEIRYLEMCELLTIDLGGKIRLIKRTLDLKRCYKPTITKIKSCKKAPSCGAIPICGVGGGHRGCGNAMLN